MKRLLVLALLCSFSSFAQPAIQWQHCYGGGNSEQCNKVIQCTDGGYIAVGSSNSVNGDPSGNHGNQDFWVVKIDDTGAIQWEKSYGGTGNELAFNVLQLADGGYIIDGYKYSVDGDVTCNGNYWLIKIDNSGALVWQQCLKITLGNRAETPALIATPDHGFALLTGGDPYTWTGGHGSTDVLLVKLDSMGNVQWHQMYGGSRTDFGSSVSNTLDGGFIITGYTQSEDGQVSGLHINSSTSRYYDYFIVKTDDLGNLVWSKTLGGYNEDVPYSVVQTPDSGYAVAGISYSNDGDVTGLRGGSDVWLIKLNPAGDLVWNRCLGGTSGEYGVNLINAAGGGFALVANTSSNDWDVSGFHGREDYWVVKLNDTGHIEWQECLGGGQPDAATCIMQTTDNGYLVAGTSYSSDSLVPGNHGGYDFWIVKLYPDAYRAFAPAVYHSVYPNPGSGRFTVYAREGVHDVVISTRMGQILLTRHYNSGDQYQDMDVTSLPTGVFMVRINNGAAKEFVKR